MLLLGLATSPAAPILTTVTPFPRGTTLYHANSAIVTYVSSVTFDPHTREDTLALRFTGKWQVNPELHGVKVSPQAGVIVGADTSERKQELRKLQMFCSSLKDRRVDIFVYAGAVNKEQATYAWPEQIKIVANGGNRFP